jgi:hypothetical protein
MAKAMADAGAMTILTGQQNTANARMVASGGHVPVGAVLARKEIFNKVFDRMDRAVAHGSTFGAMISPWPPE